MATARAPSDLASKYYKYDFFTGANVGIYIHTTLVTTAVAVEFQLVQNKVPIYGYSDQLWSGYARGTVQCGGNIMLNFQHPQTLPTLIAKAQGVSNRDIESFTNESMRSAMEHIKDVHNISSAQWSDQHMAGATLQGLTADAKTKLQQYYWDGYQSTAQAINPNTSQTAGRADDHPGTFDIYITYGDYFGGQHRAHTAGQRQSFAVNQGEGRGPQQSTIRRLSHVVITGIGSTITVAGEPVLETYPFICREVI